MKAEQLSQDQKYCVEMLAYWVGGHHHLPPVHAFGTGVCINHSGDLSTYDFNKLTSLVLAAHRFAVRIEISASGPGMVKVIAHRRKHGERSDMRSFEHHPNLSDLQSMAETFKSISELTPQ